MNVSSELIDRLRDPGEKQAFIWLAILALPLALLLLVAIIASFGLGLIVIGIFLLARYLAELFAAAYIKSNAIEVGEQQLPDVHYAVQTCCERLGIREPIAVYVLQENLWNAFAAKLASRRVVVLLSGALDSILLKGDMNQLTWLIGHEIGHHAAGHLDFLAKFLELGAWLPWIYPWYSRRRELTCDRIGLYCCGSVDSALLAISNLTVGAQLAADVNVDQAIAQWYKHSHEIYVIYRTIYSKHPPKLWRMEAIRKAAVIMGMMGKRDTVQKPVM